MGVSIDGRDSVSYSKDNKDMIIRVEKKSKDNYSLSYCQGEVIGDNLSKSEAENVLSYMQSRYYSSL